MGEPFHFGAVILAAGASTRMGRPKQMLPVDGQPLLRRTAAAVLASGAEPIVVVLGAEAKSVRPALRGLAVQVVTNRRWREGLASSIRTGLRALCTAKRRLEAVTLILCDQPNLSADAIGRLVRHHRKHGSSIVAAHYDGHPGAPALFARRHFAELLALRGPHGARPLFTRHAEQLGAVALPELAVDLDKPSDYRRFVAHRPSPDP